MSIGEIIALGAFVISLVSITWKLHADMTSIKVTLQNDMNAIKITLERLLTKFEQVDKLDKRVDRLEESSIDAENIKKLEKRVDRLEKKIYHMGEDETSSD